MIFALSIANKIPSTLGLDLEVVCRIRALLSTINDKSGSQPGISRSTEMQFGTRVLVNEAGDTDES